MKAEAALRGLGLTLSDTVPMSLTRISCDKAIPAGLKVPNAETQAAMAEARAMMAARKARGSQPPEAPDTQAK